MKEMIKWKKKGNEDGSKQKTKKEVWWGKKGKGRREIDQREGRRGRKKGEKKKKKSFSRCFDGRSLMVREEKSIHASRATHGYQNLEVSSNSTK